MRHFCPLLIASILLMPAFAVDPEFQKALDNAIMKYPPGDYYSNPVRRDMQTLVPPERAKFAPLISKSRKTLPAGTIEADLLRPVESPENDIKTLFSEAATFLAKGRFDLTSKRYRQALLLEPENIQAKANLYDLTIINCLYQSGAPLSFINEKYNHLKERIAPDILPTTKQ